ncbi:NRAMP family divalent metal transporter [Mycobacterium sherrisii]|uniref:Manganese transporter n=1 Tax=Mycobacterium sherrisii TaxID=243061 RepID=A0A1E3SLL7_9MYCO|nr:NRAMP family divalent metal transporter [Mycobacterium sherrisii]MCV7031388.1 divalent metal cation transporter [Mycobacterium sherrisii]MEC4764966.1 NRAMP family divalent metal transporter [Mycobacterium sherrisii]ODR03002.1 manganese transporter [Mycobacterium sherrisii]ORW75618.1 manganese transporter [Mycobacterium sherrisii]
MSSIFTPHPGGSRFFGFGRNAAGSRRSTPDGVVLNPAHTDDIVGALGRIRRDSDAAFTGRFRRLRTLMVITGPGLIVMVGDNDAGGVATYSQAGQNYGVGLLWTLALLIPVLYVNQEMVLRLGAVTRAGHARLIFQRFGKFWGAFSLGDLLVVNALTVVTEFIGVAMALGFLGCPKIVAVPAAAVLLFAVVAGGSFRRWEALMFLLIAVNVLIIPMVLLVHPAPGRVAAGLVPQFPGGLNSTVLLLTVAIVGTTVAPWQLFFQQSNIVDKRITARWIPYARADLAIGIVVVMVGAIALMVVSAFGLAGTPDMGNFTDAGAVAVGLAHHVGTPAGVLFAIILLDASLIGANAIGLATTYAIGDAMGRRHSLHWKISEAPTFYGGYAALLAVSAGVAFSPDHILGLVTQGVQALAGVLLPSATVFLVLLCNDHAVLGPWVNTVRQNIIAWTIVWSLVLLSLALTATTFFPSLSTVTIEAGLAGGALIGIVGGAVAIVVGRRHRDRQRAEILVCQFGGGLNAEDIDEIDDAPSLTPAERNAVRRQDRERWQTPDLAELAKPAMSPIRRAGLLTLRAYLVVAAVFVVIKVVDIAIAGPAGLL